MEMDVWFHKKTACMSLKTQQLYMNKQECICSELLSVSHKYRQEGGRWAELLGSIPTIVSLSWVLCHCSSSPHISHWPPRHILFLIMASLTPLFYPLHRSYISSTCMPCTCPHPSLHLSHWTRPRACPSDRETVNQWNTMRVNLKVILLICLCPARWCITGF